MLRKMSLLAKLTLVVGVTFAVLIACVALAMGAAKNQIIEHQASALAETVASRVGAMRAVYTENVVGKLHADLPGQVRGTSDFWGKTGEIPLPATFVHLVGDRTDRTEGTTQFTLISGWNINRRKGLGDDFDRTGWNALLAQQERLKTDARGDKVAYAEALKQHRWKPFSRVETRDGQRVLRFMSADVAGVAACVSCHNGLEQTAEVQALRREAGLTELKSFELNELMGALSITVPIESVGVIAETATNQVLLLFIGLSSLGLGALFLTLRGSMRRIGQLTEVTTRIVKEGDLTQRIKVDTDDEIGRLSSAFADMVERLREIPAAIKGSVDSLASAASEIYSASQQQEVASQSQSSGVEEVSRTMQSLLESATHISESARGVFQNAERARETSELTAKKIGDLSTHTNRMGEILDTIRDIAERSDLLALNASLEGSRAGEAGKGFSLVAAELRRLAERVTQSVNDVKTLVSDIRSSGASTMLVMEETRKLADNTAASAKQITLVTQQQRTATEQVSRNMKDVAETLTQSSAATRETKKAAEDLKVHADKLNELCNSFRFEDTGR